MSSILLMLCVAASWTTHFFYFNYVDVSGVQCYKFICIIQVQGFVQQGDYLKRCGRLF